MNILKKIFGGGSKPDPQHQKEIASAEKLEDTEFTTKHGSQGVQNNAYARYVSSNPDLMANYEKHWKANAEEGYSQNNRGISLAEYGAMHYHKYGRNEGRSLSGGGGGGESGGGGGSGGGGYGGGYGTTNPYAGSTGNSGVDANTLALMELIKSMTESLADVKGKTADIDEVSKAVKTTETILSGGYTASTDPDKKKKSYLTPIALMADPGTS
jgi:hypothetical protein